MLGEISFIFAPPVRKLAGGAAYVTAWTTWENYANASRTRLGVKAWHELCIRERTGSFSGSKIENKSRQVTRIENW